jgi:hypothetical protein
VSPAGLSIDDVRNGQEVSNQGEYIFNIKRGCEDCHQMGNKVTREIPRSIGTFANSSLAWERMLKSGQVGGEMLADVDTRFGHERGLALFADWSDRIAAGEVPVAPPRPQGLERNVVLSIWSYASDRAFIHDVASGNSYFPTANAYGRIYGADTASGLMEWLDPVEYTKGTMMPPNSDAPVSARPGPALYNEMPSPFWGDEIVWGSAGGAIGGPAIDSQGRLWYSGRPTTPPNWCGKGSDNPFAKNFPVRGSGLSPESAGQREATAPGPTTRMKPSTQPCSRLRVLIAADSRGSRRASGKKRTMPRRPTAGAPASSITTATARSARIQRPTSRPIRNWIAC